MSGITLALNPFSTVGDLSMMSELAVLFPFHSWGKGSNSWPFASVCNSHTRLPYLLGGPVPFVTYLSQTQTTSELSSENAPRSCSVGWAGWWKSSGLICFTSLQPFSTNSFVCIWKKNLSLLSIFYFLEIDMKVVIVLVIASKGINHLSNNSSNNDFQTV